jgi:hypothetical protein
MFSVRVKSPTRTWSATLVNLGGEGGRGAEPGQFRLDLAVGGRDYVGGNTDKPARVAVPMTALSGGGRISPMAAGGVEFRPQEPNVARMYDYMLGGKDNFPADREAARRTFEAIGEDVVRGTALQNRSFLGRAIRYLARDLGIRQFLDIGTGLPSMNSVHDVVRAGGEGWDAPDSRVVYVDNDPVVISHARNMLHGVDGATIVSHDLRDPETITGDPRVRSMLRFDQPIAVLLIAILHFISDADDPGRLVADLMAAVAPGSCLVISHLSADYYVQAGKAAVVYEETSSGLYLRTREAVAAMFGGLPLVPPGELVWSSQWHPDPVTPPADSPGGASLWCGIARKPAI